MSQDPDSHILNSGWNFTKISHRDTYPFVDPTKSDFSGKHVFITGAPKGIGRALASSYGKAGATAIAIGARSSLSVVESEIQEAAKAAMKSSPRILSMKLDVSNRQSVDDATREIEQAFGKLDILINNAGVLENFIPLAKSVPDEWWKSWEIMVKGPYLCTRALIPLMRNAAHIGALLISPGGAAYQTAKLALLRLTEHVMGDYGDQGLLAYCLHPGGMPTELALKMPESLHANLIDTPELAADTMV
ncbi:short chain dehydrogenase reductase, partial [Aulographum hederae CBS 113979]